MSEWEKIFLTSGVTVITGAILFCITAFFQRMIFEPVITLRKNLGELSYCLQYNAWVFYMGPTNVPKERYEKVFEELRSVTARLRADANAIFFGYDFFAEAGLIPPRKNIVEASGNLIRISNQLGFNDAVQMRDDLRAVQKLLKIDIGRPNFDCAKLSE